MCEQQEIEMIGVVAYDYAKIDDLRPMLVGILHDGVTLINEMMTKPVDQVEDFLGPIDFLGGKAIMFATVDMYDVGMKITEETIGVLKYMLPCGGWFKIGIEMKDIKNIGADIQPEVFAKIHEELIDGWIAVIKHSGISQFLLGDYRKEITKLIEVNDTNSLLELSHDLITAECVPHHISVEARGMSGEIKANFIIDDPNNIHVNKGNEVSLATYSYINSLLMLITEGDIIPDEGQFEIKVTCGYSEKDHPTRPVGKPELKVVK